MFLTVAATDHHAGNTIEQFTDMAVAQAVDTGLINNTERLTQITQVALGAAGGNGDFFHGNLIGGVLCPQCLAYHQAQ